MSQPRDDRQDDLFGPRLEEIINLRHPLVRLAAEIDWQFLAGRFSSVCRVGPGQPPLPTRLMAGLLILKHMHNLSDEALCDRWVENPYFQYFCGEVVFQHAAPFDRSSLTRWRQRLGEEQIAALLQESLSVAHRAGAIETKDLERIVVDTTVQEKAIAHPTDTRLIHREIEQRTQAILERGIALDLAANVPDDAAEPGAQEFELPPGALELVGMRIAPHHDGGALGHAQIALAQFDTLAFGQRDQFLNRAVGEPSVGRVRDRLLLDGGIHHHALEILALDSPGPVCHRKALLQERRDLLLTQPLAPARQRRAVKWQLVPEHHFAAEILEIRVLYPPVAQRLVREVVHVFEDEQPGHQPCWQRRLPRPYATYRTEALRQKVPINLRREPHQRMAKVDDRLQRRAKQVVLAVVARLAHRSPPANLAGKGITNRPNRESQNARKPQSTYDFLAKPITCSDQIIAINQWLPNTSRATK